MNFLLFSALRIHGKSATFRQHYYPEGGWGWVITFCCFLVNIFTTGLQLSFSVLSLEIIRLCGTVCREDKISVGELPIWSSGRLKAATSFVTTRHVASCFNEMCGGAVGCVRRTNRAVLDVIWWLSRVRGSAGWD